MPEEIDYSLFIGRNEFNRSEKEEKEGAKLYARTHESTDTKKTSKKIVKKMVESLSDESARDDEEA